MTATLPFTADLIQAFGWALLHSFWQALLVYSCLRLVLFLWPQASASIKYNLSFISLTGIFGWFVITLWQQLQTAKEIHLVVRQMIDTGIRPVRVDLPAIYHSQTQLKSIFPNLEFLFPLFIVIYITGVAVMTIKLTMDLLQLRQIRRKQVLPIDAVWEKHLDKLLLQLQLSRKVKLMISEHIQVPVMIGFLKPLIILPVIMFNNLTAEQLEAILLHELAHIKRNDYLLNIFQSIVETILFFNPFVWLISKNIRIEREHCCDDLVITGKIHPLHYAKALVALEEYRLTVNNLAMAAANNKQHLFHRIKRIMEMKTKNINYTQKLLAVLIIAVGLVSIAWLNPGNAMPQNKQAAKKVPVAVAPAIVPPSIHLTNYAADTVPVSKQAKKQQAEKEHAEELDAVAKDGMEAANEAMKNIDWNQINAEVSTAMQNIDWKQINTEVSTAMKNINWDEISKNTTEAMKNIDWKQISAQAKFVSLDGKPMFDTAAMNQGMRIGMESAKAAMANMSAQNMKQIVAVAMASAQKSMAEAKASADQGVIVSNHSAQGKNKYDELIRQMIEDKLIDNAKGYTIQKKDGVLSINGEIQPKAIADKYRKALSDDQDITIMGKDDNLTITVNSATK
jgi:bla regulator protein BlaR1